MAFVINIIVTIIFVLTSTFLMIRYSSNVPKTPLNTNVQKEIVSTWSSYGDTILPGCWTGKEVIINNVYLDSWKTQILTVFIPVIDKNIIWDDIKNCNYKTYQTVDKIKWIYVKNLYIGNVYIEKDWATYTLKTF